MLDIISKTITDLKDKKEVKKFLFEILTESEISDLTKRWQILKMLTEGITQRQIAKELNVSLCKITRGAKILNDKNSICYQIMKKEEKEK